MSAITTDMSKETDADGGGLLSLLGLIGGSNASPSPPPSSANPTPAPIPYAGGQYIGAAKLVSLAATPSEPSTTSASTLIPSAAASSSSSAYIPHGKGKLKFPSSGIE